MSLIDDTYALISSPVRSIGGIFPHVTIEEQHRDDLVITEFPVEDGAAITDHSYKRPSSVVMRIGFSNSTAGYEGYVEEAYRELLALQASRRPFDVTTGKRRYTSMLMGVIDVVTDAHSENALMVSVALRQIILTSTASAPSSGQANDVKASTDPADQSMPAVTQSPSDLGTRQLAPYSEGTGSFNGVFSLSGNAMFLSPEDTQSGVGEMIAFDPANPSQTFTVAPQMSADSLPGIAYDPATISMFSGVPRVFPGADGRAVAAN